MDNTLNTLKLFSDITKLRIIILLSNQDLCVCQLSGIMEISQPNVSKKLASFRKLKLVETQRKSRYTFYSLLIKKQVFIQIISNITNNLSDYPIIQNDLKMSENAESFIKVKQYSKKQS